MAINITICMVGLKIVPCTLNSTLHMCLLLRLGQIPMVIGFSMDLWEKMERIGPHDKYTNFNINGI